MPNLRGVLVRLSLPTFIIWPAYVAGIAALTLLWRSRGVSLHTIALGLPVVLFTIPHVHVADLSLLAITALLLPRLTIPLVSVCLVITQATHTLGWASAAMLIGFGLAVLYDSADDKAPASSSPAPAASAAQYTDL
jgi:hypothetical protein